MTMNKRINEMKKCKHNISNEYGGQDVCTRKKLKKKTRMVSVKNDLRTTERNIGYHMRV